MTGPPPTGPEYGVIAVVLTALSRLASALAVAQSPQREVMVMARPLTDIDRELKAAVDRRTRARFEISRLSQAIVSDTRAIDRLLIERAAAAAPDSSLHPRPA